MNIEWLIANETSVGSPDRVERGIFRVILDVLWPIQTTSVVRESRFVIYESPLEP